MTITRALLSFTSMAALAWASGPALAQEAPASTAAAVPSAPATQSDAAAAPLGDIIVTARRRSESLQTVPVAITAISGNTLLEQHIVTASDLTRVAPSLNIAAGSAGGANAPQLTIRGQRQGNFGPAYDPSVGVYLGDIVFESPLGFNQSLFDLNSVQVLKGPQGTLFGRNTTGGAILLQPNLPNDTGSVSGHVSLGDYNLHEVDAVVNLPVSDTVQLRIAGHHIDRDGYIHDLTSHKDDSNLDGSGVRISLRIKPTDSIDSVTVGNYLTSSVNEQGYKLRAIVSASAIGALYPTAQAAVARSQSLGFYQTESGPAGLGFPGFSNVRTYSIANTTSLKLNDEITLKNIIGYIHSRDGQVDDQDGSPLPLVTFGDFETERQFTEEAQILGKEKYFNWIFGAYYFRQNASYNAPAYQVIEPFLSIIPDYSLDRDKNTSKSVFGSGTYDFSELVQGVSATFGGRYTWDTRDAKFGTVYDSGTPNGFCAFTGSGVVFQPYPDCSTHQVVKFSAFTYNVDLDYNIARGKLLYFAHRKGYRTGGFNIQAVNLLQLTPFKPETVNDYELGAKLDWHFGGAYLRTNGAIYTEKYNDIQKLGIIKINGTISNNIGNAARATINGAEFETTFIPVKNIELSGFFNYTRPKYDKYIVLDPVTAAPTDVTNTASFAGVPRTSFGLTGRFIIPASEQFAVPVVQVNYYHQTKYDQNDYTVPTLYNTVPAYSLLNLRAELNKIAGSNFDLAFFMTNALNHRYFASVTTNETTLGNASTIAAPPRMFGFEASFHFGG